MPSSELDSFCLKLASLKLTHVQQALAILWFVDNISNGAMKTSGELARKIRDTGLGSPHSTKLGEAMLKSKLVLGHAAKGMVLKPTARAEIARFIKPILGPAEFDMDHKVGYLPEDVWTGTISYIGKLAKQLNACYEIRAYDAAAVMMRRIIETLLIEAYEAKGYEQHITDKSTGNYQMLGSILIDAVDQNRLKLSRDGKDVLGKIKKFGDRSAHNRRYIAVERDLGSICAEVRLVVDELLHLANKK